MFSTPQTPLQAGLAPSSGSAMQISGPTSSQCSSSQIPTASSNIFSHAELELQPSPIVHQASDSLSIDDLFKSIFGVEPTTSLFDVRISKAIVEDIATCYNEQDFSPVLQASPPAASKTSFWYRDALDKAGERVEKFLYPAFKALLMSIQIKSDEKESREQMIKDAILIVSQALHEARKCRIEGRFGFRAAEKMDSEPSGGLLTKRQEQILEELSKEQKMQQGSSYIYSSPKGFFSKKYHPTSQISGRKRFFKEVPGRRRSRAQDQGEIIGRKTQQDEPRDCRRIRASSDEKDFKSWKDRRSDSGLYTRMEKNRRRKINQKWSPGSLAQSQGKRLFGKEENHGRSSANEHEPKNCFSKGIEGAAGNRDCEQNSSQRCEISEQYFPHSEEVRSLEADFGLPNTKRCNDEISFQMRERKNCRKINKHERLRGDNGFISSLLSNSCFKRTQTLSYVQVRRHRLCFQRHAVRLHRCSKVFHKSHEESHNGNQKKMERESDIILGRSDSPASRFQHVERNHKRGDSIFGKSGLDYQQGQMFNNPEEKVHFSGVCMGHGSIHGSIVRGEVGISQSDAESMESEGNKSQNSSNKGFCLSNWKAQRSKIRTPGCVTSPCSSSSSPTEEREDIRMERCDEDECFSVEGDSGVAMDIEPESTETITTSVYSPGCVNDRCCGNSMVCNIQSEQQHYGLARQVPQQCLSPIVQLQRTTSCFASASPFFADNSRKQNIPAVAAIGQQLSGFQHKSLECREESSASATQDMEMDGGKESDNKSTTSSRKKEPQSGCAVSIGKGRRLRNKGRSTRRVSCTVESETDSRCFCIGTQSQSGKMVWSRQSNCRRWIDSSLEQRVCSSSSTDTSDSDGNTKGSDGESSSDNFPAEL